MTRLATRFALLIGLLATSHPTFAQSAGGARPTLVVLITIDQMRGDYLERFGSQLTGGLGRLMRGGAWYTNAHHDHAITETAPGHATLLSGRFPRSTGITMNGEGVGDASFPLLAGGVGGGASPRRFTGTTLVDWLHARDARSHALSVSTKDRGAILPVGRARADVYWYSPDGRFVTSRYYREMLPAWVSAFNDRHLPQRYAGRTWALLLPEASYPERDDVPFESGGVDRVFPHALPADSLDAASVVRATPFGDELTVALALDGVQALALGAGPQTDVLAVSLSATDYVGHRFGPDSREMHDAVLRVDRTIGVLVDSLYRLRDSSRVVIALTSDHGVGRIPEVAAAEGMTTAARVDLAGPLLPMLGERLRRSGIDPEAVALEQQLVVVDRTALAGHQASADSILAWLAGAARAVAGVRRVDAFRSLLADTLTDQVARRWSHQMPAGAPVALVVTLDSLSSWGGNIASHGSAYEHDSHVPLIFYGAGIRAGTFRQRVRTVDIAPTLAALLGVRPLERLDGVVLRDVLP